MPSDPLDFDCPEHGERIGPGDPRYDSFRIRELWLFVAVDPKDDQEGVVAGPDGLPLIATDRRRYEDVRAYAQWRARQHGVQVRALRCDRLTVAETFDP